MNVSTDARVVLARGIGFRHAGTRVLAARAGAVANDVRLEVVAAAAAPDRTDVIVEWTRTRDAESCTLIGGPPINGRFDAPTIDAPERLDATVAAGGVEIAASACRRGALSVSAPATQARYSLQFPGIRRGRVELRIRDGERVLRVPLELLEPRMPARSIDARVEREGISIAATAIGRDEDELVVALEVDAPLAIRQLASPLPSPVGFAATSDETRRARVSEMRRVFGAHARPILLEDDRGGSTEEVRRLDIHEPDPAPVDGRFVRRATVVFDLPADGARPAALVIPFVELLDREPAVTVDLREVPLDAVIGGHRFRVVSAEPYGTDERKVTFEAMPSGSSPWFVQPSRLRGLGDSCTWSGPADPLWLATRVGDPPVVTFSGVVLRHEGPWRLTLPNDLPSVL